MNKIGRFLYFFVAISTLTSCAHDGLAERCSKTDWYHRAYDQAVLGQPLRDGGELLRNCDKRGNSDKYVADTVRGTEEGKAIYCSPESIRKAISQGEKVDLEFCGTDPKKSLQQAASEGTRLFCQPENGLTFASKGGKYTGQCTRVEEKTFLPKYKSGRRSYARREIEKNEQYLSQLETQLEGLNLQRINLKKNRSVPWFPKYKNEDQGNEVQNRNNSLESNSTRNERDSFEKTDSELVTRITRIKTQQSQIRSQNKQLQSEL